MVNNDDVSRIKLRTVHIGAFLGISVTDADTAQLAVDSLNAIGELEEEIAEKIGEPCSTAAKLHKQLVALRDECLAPCKSVKHYLREQLSSYYDRTHFVNISADPWDDHTLTPGPRRIAGVTPRNKPLEIRITDKKRFIIAVAAELAAGNDSVLDFLVPDLTAIRAKARAWGKSIAEDKLPGVEIIQGRTVALQQPAE